MKRTKFQVRQLHNVTHKFKSVSSLQLALYDEFGDQLPDNRNDFSFGYFEGRQQSKKWLVTNQDLCVMYSVFQDKTCVSLWCDGKYPEDESSRRHMAANLLALSYGFGLGCWLLKHMMILSIYPTYP